MTALVSGSRVTKRERLWALILVASFVIATLFIALLGRTMAPNGDAIFAVTGMIWAFSDLFTAFLLFVQCRLAGRAAFGVAALAYTFSGALTFPYLGAFFGLFGVSVHTVADQQLPPFFFLVWHVAFPLIIIAGHFIAWSRAQQLNRRTASRVTFALVFGVAAIATLTVFAGFLESARLPHFILDGFFQRPWEIGVAVVIIVNAVGALVLVARSRRLSSLEIWLAVVMFGVVLEGFLNVATPVRFTYAYDFGEVMSVVCGLIVICRLSFDNIRLYARSLELVDIQSHQAASRLRAIWQIATSDGLSERDFVQVALDVAVANVRPSRNVFGFMSHISAGNVVVDAVSFSGDRYALASSLNTYAPGCTFALDSDLHARLAADGGVLVWQKARAIPKSLRCSTVGWNAVIGVAMPVGTETHFLIAGVLESLEDQPFADEDSAFIHVVASNISHRFHQRSSLERVRFQQEHDALTGLSNRIQCLRLARSAIASQALFAVILIDLDQLRLVNARLGQRGGDELLVEIAGALRAVDARDVVCRFAGDQFAVIMHYEISEHSLERRLHAYRTVFTRPFSTRERDGVTLVHISASLGGVLAEPGMKIETMLECANVALDAAKASGGGSSAIYTQAMRSALEEISSQRAELLEAIERDQLRLEYQPTYDMQTRSIVGAEALIRWEHPTRGMLQPGAFLEAAKRAKVMVPLTAWVVHRIARDLEGATLPSAFRCYFNVTATVLEDKAFLTGLEQELYASPGLNRRLGLEVTESEVMSNVERAIEALKAVRKMGLLVAVDDFGTGYSSLSYLKRLPIDTVKLDRSFIDGLPDNPGDVALAEMFVELTKRFSLTSVAEGIENERQAAWLSEHGCMVAQGFLFSRPVTFDRLLVLLTENAVGTFLRVAGQVELGLT